MALKNCYEIVALVSAKMCNPNGDPDMANSPRMDMDTNIGIITDTAFKARMRRYVQDAYPAKDGYSILMRNGNSLNRAIAESVLDVNNATSMKKGENRKVSEAADFMCKKYWDVRTFGAVLTTGLNAGQVRGAVQVAMASSVDPIDPIVASITRCCYTEGDYGSLAEYDVADAKLEDNSKRTMGTKAFIPYGLYIMKMTVSANLAEKTGFSEDDLQILLESVMQMYNLDASASKMGMSVLSPIVVFKHVGTTDPSNIEQLERECKLGCVSAYHLFNMISVERKADVELARDYTDYDVKLHMENLPAGVVCGVKKAAYQDVEWLDTTATVDLLGL